MKPNALLVTGCLVASAIACLAAAGPIPQPTDYHAFADGREFWGLANAADVLSNMAFAVVACWGLVSERWHGRSLEGAERISRRCFLVSLAATALGSAQYHLSPNDVRLVFDRLPIACACASVLSAFHARSRQPHAWWVLPALLGVAATSVAWWAWTNSRGADDLRPYLLLQGAPLLLVPLWQWACGASWAERWWFGAAAVLYGVAKAAEVFDHVLFEMTTIVSGHTLKHLLAAAAAACIVASLRAAPPKRAAIAYASLRNAPRNP